MKTFVEFVQIKQNNTFNEGLTMLLMPVVEGRLTMDDLIENVILPVFKEDTFVETQQELMNEFLGKLWDRLRGRGGQQAPAPDPAKDAVANTRFTQNQAANRIGDQQYKNPNARAAGELDARRQGILEPIMQKMKALVQSDLAPAVDKIADAMKNDAYKTGNRHLFQAANGFRNTIMKTAQNMQFQFKQMAGGGRDEFNIARRDARYSPEKLAAMKRQKQALANYAQGLSDDGSHYRLAPTPEEKAAAAARPIDAGDARSMGMDQLSTNQRDRIERKLQRRRGDANVIGNIRARPGRSASAATA